jgi:BolA protein
MSNHIETKQKIKKLLLNWGAKEVEVYDNSHLHVGHEGAKSGGGHFAVKVVSNNFTGKSRIQCHRLVYQQLSKLFASGAIHALEVEAITDES